MSYTKVKVILRSNCKCLTFYRQAGSGLRLKGIPVKLVFSYNCSNFFRLKKRQTVMKPLWYLGFILVLERFSVFIFQDLRAFQQLEFNYII